MIYWFLHLLVRHRNNHELLEKRTATRLQPKDRGVLANLFSDQILSWFENVKTLDSY